MPPWGRMLLADTSLLRFARRAAVVLPLVGLLACNSGPTVPQPCVTTEIFAGEQFYAERTEPEQDFRGTLVFRDVASTPSGRDHRYFLNDMPVYSGGLATEPIFKATAGTAITARGKLVNFTHGQEIWLASLTSCG